MTIFPTAYLPTIAYMARLAREEQVVIEQHETFPKQTLRNRAVVETANGRLSLVVPVTRPQGNHTMTGQMGITYAEHWNVQHWRAIESAYNSSPYFLYYQDGIEKILAQPHERLVDLNMEILLYLCKKLKIETRISLSEDYLRPECVEHDWRGAFPIKKTYEGFDFPPYNQVFGERHTFEPDLSIVDLLFNLGPEARDYLIRL